MINSQGELEVTKETQKKGFAEEREGDVPSGADDGGKLDTTDLHRDVSKMPFLMLGLDLPPPPLFKDVMEKNIIPQVSLCTELYMSSNCEFFNLLISFNQHFRLIH